MDESYIFFDQETEFEGEVNTDRLVLEGEILGDIRADEGVFLKEGSLVQGEISTKKYLVQEGSAHQGRLRMDLSQDIDKADEAPVASGPISPLREEQEEKEVQRDQLEARNESDISPFQKIYEKQQTHTDTGTNNPKKRKKAVGDSTGGQRLW